MSHDRVGLDGDEGEPLDRPQSVDEPADDTAVCAERRVMEGELRSVVRGLLEPDVHAATVERRSDPRHLL